jgi:ATP adenylyltransferase
MPRKSNLFSKDKQLNSRLRGEYNDLAHAAEEQKCVFCDLKDKYIVGKKAGMVLTVNIFPYINGQLLIIPERHIESFEELKRGEWQAIYDLSRKGLKVLDKILGVKGVWMILRDGETGPKSGKTVRHLHWNIMPYSDNLNTWHYQKITVAPLDLAKKLRNKFKHA